MSERATFLKHTAIYGLGGLLLQAAGVVLLPLYTRRLAQADFGILEIINRTGEVLIVLLMARGLSGAAFTFYCQAGNRVEKARVAATVFLAAWVIIVCALILTWLCARPLSTILAIDDERLLMLGMAATLSQLLPALPMTFMQARMQSIAFVCASMTVVVLRVSFVVTLVAGLKWGIWGVLWGTLLSSLLAGAVLTAIEFRSGEFRPDWGKLVAVLRFAWPFIPNGLFGFVLFSGDRYFLLKAVGPKEVGVYALAAKLADLVSLVAFAPLFKVWSAWLYRVYAQSDGDRAVGRAFTWLLLPYISLGAAVCIFRREITLLLGTDEYIGASSILVPLIVARGLLAAQVLMDGAFYVYQRTTLKLAPTVIAAMAVVCFQLVMVPQYGCFGAAVAAVAAYFLYAFTTYLFSQQVFFVKCEYGRMAAVLTATVLLVWLSYAIPDGARNIPIKAATCAVWPVLLWTVGVISEQERVWIISGARRAGAWMRGVS